MVARKLLVIALAATLLIGGVAATGAASVQDGQPDNQDDDRGDAGPPDDSTEYEDGADADNGSAADRGNGSAADRGNGSATDRNGSAPADVGPDSQGPPTDMPANVPDHVTQIHETINGFLSGDVDDLGNALSEVLGGDDAGEDDADENESDDADDEAADEEAEDEDSEDEETDDDAEDDADSDDDADENDADAEESEEDADDADADA